MKNAWLVISDLHLFHKNLGSHKNYVEEMRTLRAELLAIAARYSAKGYRTNLLLLGDVFHRGYQNVFISNYDNNFFVKWKNTLGDIYSVIGNHELHYYSNNPFFTLVQTMESEKVKRITTDVWTPQGIMNTIRVVDRLEDGEVVFHFNHFSTPISIPEEGKVNIGLFHQELVCPEIVQMMEAKQGKGIWADTVSFRDIKVFDGYQYCFLGHMHQVYGAFKTDSGGVLHYLGSLGRTSSTEVNDSFLERCIPVILVDDGKFKDIEDNKITLPCESESLDKEKMNRLAQAYEETKERKAARTYVALADDPMVSLRDYFRDDTEKLLIVDGLIKDPIDPLGSEIRNVIKQKLG